MRVRLDISYDGSGFHGWAAQPGLRSVQEELETWIPRVLRLTEPVQVVCAGRTDAGVHARGQVAHVDIPDPDDPVSQLVTLHRRLRNVLPDDLVVTGVGVAPPGFDARFSAIWRRYVYRLTDGTPDPLLRGHQVALRQPVDVDAVRAAARPLLGLHDFVAFCRQREGATTIRNLHRVELRRTAGAPGPIDITVVADAFCHSMVRSLVGALVAVGTGARDAAWLAGLLHAGQRAGEIKVMAPQGLVLEEVGYPPPDQLASRAMQARATRTLDGPESP